LRARVGLVVAAALALLAAGLVVTLSHRAVRDAGSDQIAPAIFAATLVRGGELCQDSPYLPPAAATAELVVGTYGRRVPSLDLTFTNPAGATVASGHLAPGARQGVVAIPLSRSTDPGSATRLCLVVGGHSKVVIGGLGVPPSATDEVVNGRPQAGRISVVYDRAGEESWWSLLGVIDERFGLGKAGFFGDWTLPACVVLLAAAWALAIGLLVRDAR
jgi:hypothetical protein